MKSSVDKKYQKDYCPRICADLGGGGEGSPYWYSDLDGVHLLRGAVTYNALYRVHQEERVKFEPFISKSLLIGI